jgi:hypothetical protein
MPLGHDEGAIGWLARKADVNRARCRHLARDRLIEHALEPLRDELKRAAFDQLVSAITTATGIEAMVVLRDIRGLDPAAACETIRWTAQALMRGARAQT